LGPSLFPTLAGRINQLKKKYLGLKSERCAAIPTDWPVNLRHFRIWDRPGRPPPACENSIWIDAAAGEIEKQAAQPPNLAKGSVMGARSLEFDPLVREPNRIRAQKRSLRTWHYVTENR